MIKIKNIHNDDIYTKQVLFTVIIEDYNGKEISTDYMTNRCGDGLFIKNDYYKQIAGTCQFDLHQKTHSGMYKAIRKWFKNHYYYI